jgi:hypothetical protein
VKEVTYTPAQLAAIDIARRHVCRIGTAEPARVAEGA